MAKQVASKINTTDSAMPQGAVAESLRLSVARTKRLKSCKSVCQMLSALQELSSRGKIMMNTIQLSTIFTRLPRLPGNFEGKQ